MSTNSRYQTPEWPVQILLDLAPLGLPKEFRPLAAASEGEETELKRRLMGSRDLLRRELQPPLQLPFCLDF